MTGGGNWFWVRDATTVVDPDQIAQAATKYAWAYEGVRAARLGLGATSSTVGLSLVPLTAQDPGGSFVPRDLEYLGAELVSVASQIGGTLTEVLADLDRLAVQVAEHSEYLATAALIYATAEGDAAQYLGVCRSLTALGCQAPSAGFTGWGLLAALPGYVAGMKESAGFDGSGGVSDWGPAPAPWLGNVNALEAQLRISQWATGRAGGALTGFLAGNGLPGTATFGMLYPPANAAQMAGTLATTWARLELLSGRADSGVVVAGATGVVWGSLTKGKINKIPLSQHGSGWVTNPVLAPIGQGVPIPLGPTRWNGAEGAVEATANLATLGSAERLGAQDQARAVGASLASMGWITASLVSAATSSAVRTPLGADALLARISRSRARGETGEIQILHHQNPGSDRSSWSVIIRGTQQWAPGGTNPQDMGSNLKEVAGKISTQQVGVRLAMEMAGISDKDPVEFVGHSQGGAVALALAADPEVQKNYDVVSVLTAGAPISPNTPGSASILALENLADLVPALDGAPAYAGAGQSAIYFDAAALEAGRSGGAHSLETYVEAARRLGELGDSDPRLESMVQWEQSRKEGLGLGSDTTTAVSYFATARVRGQAEE